VNVVGWVGIGIAAALLVVLVIYYLLWARRGGYSGGLAQRSRLRCPKCGQTFDYDWIPGAALTAVRLGNSRYMACPLCGHWSTFNLLDTRLPAPGASAPPPAR
jgi:DNA-directed RNA polymerase subunit RPC12/RpoP